MSFLLILYDLLQSNIIFTGKSTAGFLQYLQHFYVSLHEAHNMNAQWESHMSVHLTV
jgi:hypothetical protein